MAFICPKCGGDHGAVKLANVQRRTVIGQGLEPLPDMTIDEFAAAHPGYEVIVNAKNRQPAAWHLAAPVVAGTVVVGTVHDEVLHTGDYPMRLADGTWVTVNGVFKLGRAVQDYEQSRDTASARFFVGGRSTVGLDPLLIDALIRPLSPAVADDVRARNAAFEAAQEAAKESVDPELAEMLAATSTRAANKADALLRDAIRATTDPNLAMAAREAEIAAMAPPFPVIEYEEITLPDGEVKKIPVRFTFSDGTIRTAQDFAVEENAIHRARLRL
jgi:hypothetical protein